MSDDMSADAIDRRHREAIENAHLRAVERRTVSLARRQLLRGYAGGAILMGCVWLVLVTLERSGWGSALSLFFVFLTLLTFVTLAAVAERDEDVRVWRRADEQFLKWYRDNR